MPNPDPQREQMLMAVLANDLATQTAILDSARPLAGPPAPPLNPPNGNGTSGDMDPWQTSVEKRLDSLDARTGRIEADVSSIKVDVGVLKEKVSNLPGKGFIVTAATSALVLVAGLSAFVQWVLSVKG